LVERVFDETVERFDRVDVAVHAAAVAAYGRFPDIPPDVFERVHRTNIVGTVNVARAALRKFDVQGQGHLVLLGSLLGDIVTPFMSPYVTSKWAVHGLARILQIETAGAPHIHVGLVSPGAVDTGIYAKSASYLDRLAKPPPPVVQPERVADAVMKMLARPRRKAIVGPLAHVSVPAFRTVAPLFDRVVTPLLLRLSFEPSRVTAHPGNVFAPVSADQIKEMFTVPEETSKSASSREGDGRVVVRRLVDATREEVWAVLGDGWLYPNWVVGTTRMRDVDESWPMPGSVLHHSVGVWPAVLDDVTKVTQCEPGSRLVLEAQGWPLGKAEVEIELTDAAEGTEVSIREDAISGPGLFVPRPVRQQLIILRNREGLRRLAFIAERRGPVSD
jgi:short-subunit dehydrogenase